MFRNFESGKEKERNPFDRNDFFEDDIWARRDRLWEMLENRKTNDPHDNFFSSGPKRIALEGEVYYNKYDKTIYVGNKKGTWTKINGLKAVRTSFAESAFIINSVSTGVGTVLGNVKGGAKEVAELRNFEAMSFHPQGSYEFNKLVTKIERNIVLKHFIKDKVSNTINDGKIYIEGTAESVSTLKNVANVAKWLGYSAGFLGVLLSAKEYEEKKISGEILALDIFMTWLSFTGPGAFIAGAYFILIRTDTKDKYFDPKPENIYESAKIKIDNTRVDGHINKIILKQ